MKRISLSSGSGIPKIILFLTGMLLVSGSPLVSETRRALMVGIDRYQPGSGTTGEFSPSGAGGRGSWQNLNGAVNDMKAMRDLLIARFGFRAHRILALENEGASRRNILSAFREHLIREARPGDICLFFYAGHGSQVANSSTREEDGLDESLVPADSHRGARDIRDKELWKLYNGVQEKGAHLTVIVDSCHSGSLSRGLNVPLKARYLSPDLRDASDPTWFSKTPAEMGALIVSAAQDFEQAAEFIDENRHNHGLFTWALLKTLRTVPVDEPAARILLRVKALMRAQGKIQEPNIEATPARKRGPLFGTRTGTLSGRITVAVQKVEPSLNRISFLGGIAAGIRKGCELVPAEKAGGIRVRIIDVQGLSLSHGQVLEGDVRKIHSGDLFRIEKWVVDQDLRLRLHIPGSDYDQVDLIRLSREVQKQVMGRGMTWVKDPSEVSPTHILSYREGSWILTGPGPDVTNLGSSPLKGLNPLLPSGKAGGSLFYLSLPLSRGLYQRLRSDIAGDGSLLKMVSPDREAHYILSGRYLNGSIGYSLMLPNVAGEGSEILPLPGRTDWIETPESMTDPAAPAAKVMEYARQIMKIKAWLEISSPPDRGRFPYYLALKNSRTGELKTGGKAYQGEIYGLVLRTDQQEIGPDFDFHYVYVFSIDKFGRSTLLFPNRLLGTIENKLPARFTDDDKLPREIQLGSRELFGISGDAFGTDTFILLTCLKPIPDPEVLHSQGVRTRGGSGDSLAGGSGNPLQKLLAFMTTPKRGISIITPSTWSIQRISILSKPGKR